MKAGKPKLRNLNRILIQRLRKYNFQNFSQLLNCPEPQISYFSYFENLANLLYDSVYDEQSALETEIIKDFEKFPEDCIKIEDVSKEIENNNINNNIQSDTKKGNLKLILDDPMDSYINNISSKYERYNKNHKYLSNNKFNKKDEDIDKFQRFLNLKSIYESNKDILINIPDEYKVPNEQFKTDPTLLSKPINYLQIKSKGLIQMSSQIDKELEKILGHTGKLDNYIHQNWKPWNTNINIYFENIKKYHDFVNLVKKKSLEKNSILILKEIKRQNIKRLKKIFIQFKKMKESIDVLKILITDVKKYKTTQELINKSKNNVEKLKNILNKNKKVSILELFEISFDNFKNKNSTHMSGELTQILNEYFTQYAFIDESSLNDYIFFNISKDSFDILISTSYGIKYLLEHLQFKEQKDEKEKINSVCDYFIQNNLINNIYTKLRGIFTNLSNDITNKMIDFFRKELEQKEDNEEKGKNNTNKIINNNVKLREEHCLLLCLIITKVKFVNSVKDFVNEILKKINESNDNNISKIIKNNFSSECEEINNIIENNINGIIKNQLIKCFDDYILNSSIEIFFKNYYFINDLMYQLTSKDEKVNKILLEYQNIYINNWTKYQFNKFTSQEYESWDPLSEIPKEYQLLINFYFDFDIKNNTIGINSKEYISKMENFEKLKNEYLEKNKNNEEELKTEFLSVKFKKNKKEIDTINIKINSTGLDIIKTSCNIIKIFCLLNPYCYGNMLESFSAILIRHLNYQKEEIFNYKNSSVISQKEVCMTCSIFLLVKNIYEFFKDCDFFVQIMKHSGQKSIDKFLSVFKAINESLEMSKKKIEEVLNNDCVEESLKLLDKIQLPNYNIVEKGSEIPVNEYVYNFLNIMKTIYESMLNCYETDFMVKIFQNAIEKFFDKFEYFIFHGTKIVDENCLNQFRRDMNFLKKNLNFIDIFDLNKIKSRIENIKKKVLPDNMLKPKKKMEDK